MDDEAPVIFEGKPGLCWYCARGEAGGQMSEDGGQRASVCLQWKATSPVAVSSCRSFLPAGSAVPCGCDDGDCKRDGRHEQSFDQKYVRGRQVCPECLKPLD